MRGTEVVTGREPERIATIDVEKKEGNEGFPVHPS